MANQAQGHQESILQRWMAFIALSSCIFRDVSGQTGLTSPFLTSMNLRSGSDILALQFTGPASKPAMPNLLTKLSGRQLPLQHNASTRESEIAAIFRGVAYGVPAFSIDITTITTSTTLSAKTSPTFSTIIPATSISRFSNSLQDPVRSELMRHQLEKEIEPIFTAGTTPDVLKEDSNSISYILHEGSSFSDPSYRPHTTDPSSNLNKEKNVFPSTQSEVKEPVIVDKKNINVEQPIPMTSVKWTLGAAWWIHVYLSASLFALIAAASLCFLVRLSPASHLISCISYVILLVLLFVAAILRCLHLFYDPYGIENRLPELLSAVVKETSGPCLTGAITVVALTLYQSGRSYRVFPKSSRLQFILAFCTTTHLILSITVHLSAFLLEKQSFPLKIAIKSVTVTWTGIVGLGSLWTVWKVKRSTGQYSGQLLGRLNRSVTTDLVSSGKPHSVGTCVSLLILIAGVAQIILAILVLYTMLAPVTPTKHVWMWWGRVSMARGLELTISVAILVSAFILTSGHSSNDKNDCTIFSMLTSCGRDGINTNKGRSADIFPIQNEKQKILGSFNIHPNKPQREDIGIKRMPIYWTYTTPRCANKVGTIDSVTSDFQLLWNHDRSQSAARFRPPSMLVNDSGFVRFRTYTDPEQAMDDVFNKSSLSLQKISSPLPYNNVQNYCTQTLPNSYYYCKPNNTTVCSPERKPIRNPIRSQTVHAQRSKPDYLHYQMRKRAMSQIREKNSCSPITSARKYNIRTIDKYELPSYYNCSITSNDRNKYLTPNTVSPSKQLLKVPSSRCQLPGVHGSHHHYEEDRNLKPFSAEAISGVLEPSTCSSHSEIHVDYLTDVSSSNDCVNQTSLPYINCSKGNQSLLTLHLSSSHTNYTQTFPTSTTVTGKTQPLHLPDITPDSAVILDYSTSAETEEEPDNDERNNKCLDVYESEFQLTELCN